MTPIPTSVALVLPIPSFAISGPMTIKATIEAASRSRRWTSTQVFAVTARTPFGKFHNNTTSFNITTIQVISCIISISRIAKFNKGEIMLHIHTSNSSILAESSLEITFPGP
uniref:Uncharacterized protein n=1 Tax=Lotus japonicus TaxID=34305 RepID=I3S5F6_LOTJA|nr:unknown [Lotus japonicus]